MLSTAVREYSEKFLEGTCYFKALSLFTIVAILNSDRAYRLLNRNADFSTNMTIHLYARYHLSCLRLQQLRSGFVVITINICVNVNICLGKSSKVYFIIYIFQEYTNTKQQSTMQLSKSTAPCRSKL